MVEHPFLMFMITFWLGAVLTLAGYAAYYVGKNRFVNAWVGFRTYSTRSNPDVWEEINVASGLSFIKLGVAIMVFTLLFRGIVITYFLPFTLLVLGIIVVIVIKYAYDARSRANQTACLVIYPKLISSVV